MNWFDLPPEELKKHINSYLAQRNKCNNNRKKDRNDNFVEMRLTFQEWMEIWWSSGHLKDRDSHGYVMARTNDIGHYEIGNVRIVWWTENVAEAGRSPGKLAALKKALADRVVTPETRTKIGTANSRPCTIDGITIYESVGALCAALGNKARQNPNFRHILKEPQKMVTCPHCGKMGANRIMKRWHFGNCKLSVDQIKS